MIRNIDLIYRLKNEYEKWDLEFIKDKDLIKVKGSLNDDLEELFDLVRSIRCSFSHSLSINIINENFLEIKKSDTVKYNRMYTSGCFDIFHYGHLNILEKTKALCNHLIVGVSTDELIEKEKGRLPVIPFEERLRIVEAIKYVDEVIPQFDKNKQRVVDEYNIDAISVGDDWLGRFPETSCEVEYLPYTKSVSSTILKKVLKV